jgi:hypothetical protein
VWAIIKFDKKKLNLLLEDFNKKLGKEYKIYIPRLKLQRYKNNKVIRKEINLLGDYMFCFHNSFDKSEVVSANQNLRGLKYFLLGFKESQKEITDFIKKCKSYENEKGFLLQNFYDLVLNKSYQFFSGPFTNKIFKIVEIQKNKINILMGNLRTTVKKENSFFRPI